MRLRHTRERMKILWQGVQRGAAQLARSLRDVPSDPVLFKGVGRNVATAPCSKAAVILHALFFDGRNPFSWERTWTAATRLHIDDFGPGADTAKED